jgi:hypothetical protein
MLINVKPCNISYKMFVYMMKTAVRKIDLLFYLTFRIFKEVLTFNSLVINYLNFMS